MIHSPPLPSPRERAILVLLLIVLWAVVSVVPPEGHANLFAFALVIAIALRAHIWCRSQYGLTGVLMFIGGALVLLFQVPLSTVAVVGALALIAPFIFPSRSRGDP